MTAYIRLAQDQASETSHIDVKEAHVVLVLYESAHSGEATNEKLFMFQ